MCLLLYRRSIRCEGDGVFYRRWIFYGSVCLYRRNSFRKLPECDRRLYCLFNFKRRCAKIFWPFSWPWTFRPPVNASLLYWNVSPKQSPESTLKSRALPEAPPKKTRPFSTSTSIFNSILSGTNPRRPIKNQKTISKLLISGNTITRPLINSSI